MATNKDLLASTQTTHAPSLSATELPEAPSILHDASSETSSCGFPDVTKHRGGPGFGPGDRVYFACGSIDLPGGLQLKFGSPGTVVGPTVEELAQSARDVTIWFDGFPHVIDLPINNVLPRLPELPGGYYKGQNICYTGGYLAFPDGGSLSFGQRGEVVGCSATRGDVDHERIQVKFEGNKQYINVYVWQASQYEPVLPEGYCIGDNVYYIGGHEDFLNGDMLEFGLHGVVSGVPVEDGCSSKKHLHVRFDGHRAYTNVLVSNISREPLAIPGGYSVGSRIVYTGKNWSIESLQLSPGALGEVVGRSTRGDGLDHERIKVRFDKFNYRYVNVPLEYISEQPPGAQDLESPDLVYYSGGSIDFPNGDKVSFGMRGKVIDESRSNLKITDQQHMLVLFDGNASSTRVPTSHVTRTVPRIPGFLNLGECVYFVGGHEQFPDGSRLGYGMRGTIVGCSTPAPEDHRVEVKFEANDSCINILPSHLTSHPPVLPQGYNVDDDVFYAGCTTYFQEGDQLAFGSHGVVVGRSTVGDGADDQRIKVQFQCSKEYVDVFVFEVCKSHPVIPGGFSIGDLVYYSGDGERLAEGRLALGLPGRVLARSTVGDGHDDERVQVWFLGNQDATTVPVSKIHRGRAPEQRPRTTGQLDRHLDNGEAMLALAEDVWFTNTRRSFANSWSSSRSGTSEASVVSTSCSTVTAA